jgi:membrane protease subunit HflK
MDLGTVFTYAAMGVGGLFALGTFLGGFYTVEQEHQGLVTRFGKHVRTNDTAGLKFKIPWIESVSHISMQEFQAEELLETKTTDDLFVKLPIAIHFQIDDPATYKFKKGNAIELMKKNVAAAVREYTSKKTFQELYDERQQIKEGVLAKVEEKMTQFGIQINDIVVDEPQASSEVKATFDRVRSSALEKEAAANEAEAQYIKSVRAAEAQRDRDLLRGEGAAGYRQRIFDQYSEQIEALEKGGTPRQEAVAMMMKVMELDTWREVGGEGNMVIVTGGDKTGNDIANLQTLGQTLAREQNNGSAAPKAAAPRP